MLTAILTHSVFWGPMAIAIMGGLTIATLLTIFFRVLPLCGLVPDRPRPKETGSPPAQASGAEERA